MRVGDVVEDALHARLHLLRGAPPRLGCCRVGAGELMHVRALVVIEPQDARERREHRWRRIDPALLEAGVVVGRDRRELCYLFAAKAGDSPLCPTLGQVDVARAQPTGRRTTEGERCRSQGTTWTESGAGGLVHRLCVRRHGCRAVGGSQVGAASVHFTPGARTAWHTHPHGQTIWVTEGVGLCQREGGQIEVIRAGDRVFFESAENHWHGAAPTRFMTHIAIQQADDSGHVVEWGRHVSDDEYAQAPSLEEGDR
jgi:quercetin dioxygenase-like cupin family protein